MGLPNTPALHHSSTGPTSTLDGETMKHLIGSIPSWKLTVGRSIVDVNRLTLLALMTLTLLLAGCGTVQIRNPVPLSFQQEPTVLGRSDLRFWGDDIPPQIERRLQTMTGAQIQADFPALFGRPHNYLAISGGGSNGAFGAGLLVGWTEAGNRPKFQMVTGVSTGALIAPFAFLGSAYDPTLKKVYTTISTKDIMRERSLMKILGSDAAADSTPLLATIQRYVGDDIIAAIAVAAPHRATPLRRHLRPGPHAPPDLGYRGDCLQRASRCKGPGAPDHAGVGIDSRRFSAGARRGRGYRVCTYDEMHVDGGAYVPRCSSTRQPWIGAACWSGWRSRARPTIYVIRNSALKPDREAVEPKLAAIAGRSISSLIRTQGIGDLYLIYMIVQTRRGQLSSGVHPRRFR